MNKDQLAKIVADHALWLRKQGGSRADLIGADLSRADLRGANLSGAGLSEANLTDANLTKANLTKANLTGAGLSEANLTDANLTKANLTKANLTGADLTGANLTGAGLTGAGLTKANLTKADLTRADLRWADLRWADLRWADLSEADLSETRGLLDPADWLISNFETDDYGVIVYKGIGNTEFTPPAHWVIEPGSFLTETTNPDRGTACGCGVNFATIKWIKNNYPNAVIWRCRIRWIDLAGVVVPYSTDGKARCGKLELLEKVEEK